MRGYQEKRGHLLPRGGPQGPPAKGSPEADPHTRGKAAGSSTQANRRGCNAYSIGIKKLSQGQRSGFPSSHLCRNCSFPITHLICTHCCPWAQHLLIHTASEAHLQAAPICILGPSAPWDPTLPTVAQHMPRPCWGQQWATSLWQDSSLPEVRCWVTIQYTFVGHSASPQQAFHISHLI